MGKGLRNKLKHRFKSGAPPVRIIKNKRRHIAVTLVGGKVTRVPISVAERLLGLAKVD